MNENLTINGERPKKSVLRDLLVSESQVCKNIRELFTPKGSSFSVLGLSRHAYEGWGKEALEIFLQCLPQNHDIVQAIFHTANDILGETQTMSAKHLRSISYSESAVNNTPVVTAFNLADPFVPENIYENVKKASDYIIRQHISHPKELPLSDEPMFAVFRGISAYGQRHATDVLKLADFACQNNVISPYLISLCADIGDPRAFSYFARALEADCSHIDLEAVGETIREGLGKEFIKKEIRKTKGERLQEKLKKYLVSH